jgi:hypothetical protein
MSVIINEFDVVPADTGQEPAGEAARREAVPPSAAATEQQLDALLRLRAARDARVRAY